MRDNREFRSALLLAGMLSLSTVAAEQNSAPVEATWKPQEIRFSYTGFTTAYDCDAYESKVEAILRAVGTHPNTHVRASGCNIGKPSKNFFVTISTATPVSAVGYAAADQGKADPKVLQRLDMKGARANEPFPAEWKSVDLSRDRKLDLRPGDCELMEGLRDRVFPKLSIKVVEDHVSCTPRQLSVQTPSLKVSALAPLASADQKRTAAAKE